MKIILIIIFLFISHFIIAQASAEVFEYGYHPSNEYDTVRSVLLVTDCDDCPSKSISVLAVRQKYKYFGDPIPPGDYSDEWRIKFYIDKNKKPLSNKITIWNAK